MARGFNGDWNKSTIKNLIKDNCYLEFGKHANLKALCVNYEGFEVTDWDELTFVVPTEWLKEFCKNEFGVQDLDVFLQEEYTSEESNIIFWAALKDRQVVMVDFD